MTAPPVRFERGSGSTVAGRPVRSERGSGSMLMVGVMCVVVMFSLMAICIAGYLVAVHRARSAADLAALSGASATAAGQDSCRAAKRVAGDNHVRVLTCSEVGDAIDFVVTVRVELPVGVAVPGLPKTVQAVAYAGSVPP